MPSLPQSMVFQSTLPLRGATRRRRPVPSGLAISIHTPLAGSDLAGHAGIAGTGISIHTPLAGSDSFTPLSLEKEEISIHTPLAGSDPIRRQQHPKRHISIHTPLAGSDYAARVVHGEHVDFNPHSPCGERPNHSRSIQQSLTFQSTLPLRGATQPLAKHPTIVDISIHTPLAGSDLNINERT